MGDRGRYRISCVYAHRTRFSSSMRAPRGRWPDLPKDPRLGRFPGRACTSSWRSLPTAKSHRSARDNCDTAGVGALSMACLQSPTPRGSGRNGSPLARSLRSLVRPWPDRRAGGSHDARISRRSAFSMESRELWSADRRLQSVSRADMVRQPAHDAVTFATSLTATSPPAASTTGSSRRCRRSSARRSCRGRRSG